jgi:hypothetical protein
MTCRWSAVLYFVYCCSDCCSIGHGCWSGGVCHASDIPMLSVSEIQPAKDGLSTKLCFQLLCISKEQVVAAFDFSMIVSMT